MDFKIIDLDRRAFDLKLLYSAKHNLPLCVMRQMKWLDVESLPVHEEEETF